MTWDPTQLEEQRVRKLLELRRLGVNPYPADVIRSHTTAQARELFLSIEEEGRTFEGSISVCGRLVSVRDMGKTVFAHVEDGHGRIQLFLRRDEVGVEEHRRFRKLTDLGDFIRAEGPLIRTRLGEISILVSSWQMLSKALSPLPVIKEQEVDGQTVRYSEFSDVEERFRQRYADLAVNPEIRELFRTRARIIRNLRDFLDNHDFLEVETPLMQPLYGGAAARPFTTYHNQLKQELFLRISFELYLKRLLVGGYERVYEIGRDFRNEGVDATHNPEFTQLEFYAAYWNYEEVMSFTEKMLAHVATSIFGRTTIEYQGEEIELDKTWTRMTLRDAILRFAEIDYLAFDSADDLAKEIIKLGVEVPKNATKGKLIDGLLGDFVQPRLIQPTFLTDYPIDISPLAKQKHDFDDHVERFEFFIGGMEMGNAFSELNDPTEQSKRFEEMQRIYGSDDEESHPIDEDYLRAMRYGMPPNGGFGMGVDRLVMLFTNRTSIREVLLFPHLRSRD